MTEGPRELPGKPRSHADHAAQWKGVTAPAGSQQAPGNTKQGTRANISP